MNHIADNRAGKKPPPLLLTKSEPVRTTRIISQAIKVGGIIYFALILSAESLTMFYGVIPGAILYGVLLIVLTNLSYFLRTELGRRIALVFTLLPLLRILSLVMPVQQVAPILRYVLVGVPLLLSTMLVVRVTKLQSFRLDLTLLEWIYQIIIGASGIPLGVIAALVLKPPLDLVSIPNLFWIFVHWIVLTLFGALTEEIIFRGLLQKVLSYSFGFFSILISSILYATMFIGTLSPATIIFFGLTGLLFSIWVRITDSLLGVIIAHSLLNIVFLLIIHLFGI
jgi:membrane protease YdiL (CAAX protease family)